jgi:hypothetical protein
MKKLLRASLAVAGITAWAASANAKTIWTNWNASSVVTGTPSGQVVGTLGGVTVSYTGEVENLYQGYPSYTPTSSFVGGIVQNPVSPNDSIQLFGGPYGASDTITFSSPVTNPIIAIWSLGAGGNPAQFDFTTAPIFDAGGPSFEYGGSAITISGDNVYGAEGNGSIHLVGTYSSITFTTPVFEDWFGFTVGRNIPEPASLALLGAGLLGLGVARRRKHD